MCFQRCFSFGVGKRWPQCGSTDFQADCCCKIVPLVAAMAGDPQLYEHVEDAIRLTQDNDDAVAYGTAFAAILEAAVLGVAHPLSAAVDSLTDPHASGGGGEYYGYSDSLAEATEYNPDLQRQIVPQLRKAIEKGAADGAAFASEASKQHFSSDLEHRPDGEEFEFAEEASFTADMLAFAGGRPLPGLS